MLDLSIRLSRVVSGPSYRLLGPLVSDTIPRDPDVSLGGDPLAGQTRTRRGRAPPTYHKPDVIRSGWKAVSRVTRRLASAAWDLERLAECPRGVSPPRSAFCHPRIRSDCF